MTRIVIAIEGGIVSSVTSDSPVEYMQIDYDTEGADLEDLTNIPQDDGSEASAFAAIADADVLPLRVKQLFDVIG